MHARCYDGSNLTSSNKTKDTLVPSAARDFRAQGKDCNLIFLKLQWLSELIECRNLQFGKPAVALWIPMTQK